ncbi:hypothetical protein RFI_20307 [Reticulomyxa filosa]|uniref:RGS domain-containing protein n=1 Tax=Reticulomyxa filosa TaxID=46433 RepID=X6MTP7_RETFI|nr:hypothetical protein RFI_20307 [Reticulomyxa filosa]|eukprot:ETO17031.1 hypothetical protein RFI_20307 [Reticulomyxa filosa]
MLAIYDIGQQDEKLLWLWCPSLLNGINSLIMLRPLDLYAIDDDQVVILSRVSSIESGSGTSDNDGAKWGDSLVTCFWRVYSCCYFAFRVSAKYQKRRARSQSAGGTEKENNGHTIRASITHTSHNKNSAIGAHLTLKDVLKLKHGFSELAAHLVKELSLENLLFLVEYMQLKKFVLHHELLEEECVKWRIEIASEIMDESMNKDLLNSKYYMSTEDSYHVVLSMFHYLYQHYIDRSSVASVNISYQCVNRIKYTMGKIFLFGDKSATDDNFSDVLSSGVMDMDCIEQLIDAFDSAALQVFRLLYSDSFTRFSKTKEYEILVEQVREREE